MSREKELEKRIAELELEVLRLKKKTLGKVNGDTIKVPQEFKATFDAAQDTVGEYFQNIEFDPCRALVSVDNERYILMRASSLSFEFLKNIQNLYKDRGPEDALQIGLDFLFDISHVIGIEDAKKFHEQMQVKTPIDKLSAGPVHFAYTGWAFVEILPESNPSPDDNFYLKYHHPYSFEATSWIKAGKKAQKPICIMNAGYSSGWCEASFGIPLTAVEISCRAQGDENCTFIMAPPHRIKEYVHKEEQVRSYHIPVFLDRKEAEEKLKRAKRELEKANEAKSLFLANMSHEIRTPMNAIMGFCDLLQSTKLNKEQQNHLQVIKNSGDLLISLIDDLLDLSMIEFGKFHLQEKVIDVQEIIRKLVQLLQPQFQKKNIEFQFSCGEASKNLLGDPVRIQQIFLNLLNNAIKFTSQNGEISLEISFCETDEHTTMLAVVEDNGIGIPRSEQVKIFEVFSRVDMSFNRTSDGAGLGLAISKYLVERMQGKIRVESEEGKGSKFSFDVKLKKSFDAVLEVPQQKMKRLLNVFVLLVEDDRTNQKIFEIILRRLGCKVDIANNGEEAVEQVQKSEYDIVLMDISMPKMDGLGATRKIRSLGFSMPIIALTAHAMSKEREKGLAIGMNDYICKPVNEQQLFEKIAQYT
ncbi:response regulator [Candidatus Uabimicrobium amorphum]|uniref:histidine kinase n=1 Tax=Uabimicrobium amorphum TaxID=2596890 RepID=A0A5S9IJY3_UABAM|nr:histidine kinase [Candidatus Uabimicrobium amorphum]